MCECVRKTNVIKTRFPYGAKCLQCITYANKTGFIIFRDISCSVYIAHIYKYTDVYVFVHRIRGGIGKPGVVRVVEEMKAKTRLESSRKSFVLVRDVSDGRQPTRDLSGIIRYYIPHVCAHIKPPSFRRFSARQLETLRYLSYCRCK